MVLWFSFLFGYMLSLVYMIRGNRQCISIISTYLNIKRTLLVSYQLINIDWTALRQSCQTQLRWYFRETIRDRIKISFLPFFIHMLTTPTGIFVSNYNHTDTGSCKGMIYGFFLTMPKIVCVYVDMGLNVCTLTQLVCLINDNVGG